MEAFPTAIIGTGHLAWHLAHLLGPNNVVVSREPAVSGHWPADVIAYEKLTDYAPQAIFLAVSDQYIASVSERIAGLLPSSTLVYHTSGATPVDRLAHYFPHRGVLWPIRSLRRGEPVGDWRDLPLVTYATDATAKAFITDLAHRLSDTVAYLDDTQRAQLHLAAVFSNNFVTALYEVSFRLCRRYEIPFELLLPIIAKTAGSQDGHSPALRQTGAAMRGDRATMDRHLSLLDDPTYRKLYRELSELILQHRLSEHDPDFRRDAHDDLQD